MAKIKLQRYEQVKHLPNVVFSKFEESLSAVAYPWHDKQYEGMQKVLELGCGKGEHSLFFARADKGKLCVGIDTKSHRMCVGAQKAVDEGVENIYFLRAHIEKVGEFFKKHSINEIWLTFPDPHPKTRSIKNRLTGARFLDAYADLLVPGGRVVLKTDSDLLFAYTRKSVERWGGRVIVQSEDIHKGDLNPIYALEVISAFEKKARLRKKRIKFLAFSLDT